MAKFMMQSYIAVMVKVLLVEEHNEARKRKITIRWAWATIINYQYYLKKEVNNLQSFLNKLPSKNQSIKDTIERIVISTIFFEDLNSKDINLWLTPSYSFYL